MTGEEGIQKLYITKQNGKETFTFSGNWTGLAIRSIMTHIPREYRLYQRTIRRHEVPEQTPSIITVPKESVLQSSVGVVASITKKMSEGTI